MGHNFEHYPSRSWIAFIIGWEGISITGDYFFFCERSSVHFVEGSAWGGVEQVIVRKSAVLSRSVGLGHGVRKWGQGGRHRHFLLGRRRWRRLGANAFSLVISAKVTNILKLYNFLSNRPHTFCVHGCGLFGCDLGYDLSCDPSIWSKIKSIFASACSCGGFLFARQAPSGGGYAGFVTGQRTKMAGKVL